MPSLVDLLDRALAVTATADRPDLTARLEAARRRLQDPHVRVLVVGEFKQGKSQLVNALVNAPVCPVDDDVATSVPPSSGTARSRRRRSCWPRRTRPRRPAPRPRR